MQAGCMASSTQPARLWRRSFLCFPHYLTQNAGVACCIRKLNFQLLQQKAAIKVSAALETDCAQRQQDTERKGLIWCSQQLDPLDPVTDLNLFPNTTVIFSQVTVIFLEKILLDPLRDHYSSTKNRDAPHCLAMPVALASNRKILHHSKFYLHPLHSPGSYSERALKLYSKQTCFTLV